MPLKWKKSSAIWDLRHMEYHAAIKYCIFSWSIFRDLRKSWWSDIKRRSIYSVVQFCKTYILMTMTQNMCTHICTEKRLENLQYTRMSAILPLDVRLVDDVFLNTLASKFSSEFLFLLQLREIIKHCYLKILGRGRSSLGILTPKWPMSCTQFACSQFHLGE